MPQVVSKAPVRHAVSEIRIGARHDASVDGPRSGVTNGSHGAGIEDSQQGGLTVERQVRDLVEDQRSSIGSGRQPLARDHGTGEGPPDRPEEGAFDKTAR